MNKIVNLKISFLFFLIIASLIMPVHAANIAWKQYSNGIFTQAKNQHRLVLLYFKSDSCPWCQKQNRTTFSDSDVSKLINKKYIPVKIDVNAQSHLSNQYHVRGLPTIIIMNANKNVVNTMEGYTSPEDMVGILK